MVLGSNRRRKTNNNQLKTRWRDDGGVGKDVRSDGDVRGARSYRFRGDRVGNMVKNKIKSMCLLIYLFTRPILSLSHECRGQGFFIFFHTPHRRSPIQFKKIRSATRSDLSPQGRGIWIPLHHLVGSCSGYLLIPYFPRSDVCSRR